MINTTDNARCATWAQGVALDPAGTAPRCDVLVLVEHPLPWPDDIAGDPLLATLAQVASETVGAGRSTRLQALAVDPHEKMRRVVVFHQGAPPFSGYARAEGRGALKDLPALVADLVAARPSPSASTRVTDVLICTHGSRDVCCGSAGTRTWKDAAQWTDSDVRVWRTSHTGGHRFAPTVLTFPDGNCWAHVDAEMLRGLVDRTLPAHVAAEHLRGCTAFGAASQVVDRAIFAARGWEWLDCAKFESDRGPRRVEFCFESPSGERGGYDAVLIDGRQMPVPECGADPSAARKSQTELKVASLHAWA